MFNIFGQSWALIVLAHIAMIIIWVYKAVFPDKKRKWLWLIPLIIIAGGISLDYFVKTDIEKIRGAIKSIAKAAEDENCSDISDLLSNDYKDSYHFSKNELTNYCEIIFSEPLIGKNITSIISLKLNADTATSIITIRTVFDKQGRVYQNFKMIQLTKLQFELKKENTVWLITRMELLEIDNQPVDWQGLRQWTW